MRKKFVALLLSLVLLLTCSTVSVFALHGKKTTANFPDATWTLEYTPDGEEYLYNADTGEKIIKAYGYNYNGQLVELNLSAYLIEKNKPTLNIINPQPIEEDNLFPTPRGFTWFPVYREEKASTCKGTAQRVSADLKGPGTINIVTSTTVTHSFSSGFSLSDNYKKAIQGGASFDWSTSASSASSTSYGVSVPAGVIGHMQFTPYLNVTLGKLYQVASDPLYPDEVCVGDVVGYSPQTVGSFANGLYELVTD